MFFYDFFPFVACTMFTCFFFFFFSSRRRHTRSLCDWSSDVCSSDLEARRIFPSLALLLCAYPFLPCVQAEQTDSAPLPLQRADPLIQKIISEISEERIAEILRKLESCGTRNTLSDPSQTNRGIGVARQWIFDQFKSFSPRLQVSFDAHRIPKGGRVWKDIELRNVVAALPGKIATNRWIMVAGHYDSLNLNIPPEM